MHYTETTHFFGVCFQTPLLVIRMSRGKVYLLLVNCGSIHVAYPCFLVFRYNNLNTSIMNRGKLLHSGMTSVHSFEPAADRFCTWLTDTEVTIRNLEVEAERIRDQYGVGKDPTGGGSQVVDIPQHEMKKFQVGTRY